MWKVLIVDDEVLVRKGLTTTIDWAKYGMAVVADAPNGLKALEAVERHQPHVVITDIRMPQMNGLELIRSLKETHPHVETVILSCHSDFAYAREAISLGALGYLVKTDMDDKEIHDLLNRVKERLESRFHREKTIEELAHRAQASLFWQRQADLRALLSDETGREPIEAVKARCGWQDRGTYLLLAVKPREAGLLRTYAAKLKQLPPLLADEEEFQGIADLADGLALLLFSRSSLSAMGMQELVRAWSGKLSRLFGCGPGGLVIGAGAPFASVGDAKAAYRQAVAAADAFFYGAPGYIFFYGGAGCAPLQEDRPGGAISAADRSALLEAVAGREPERAKELVEAVMRRWTPELPSSAVKEAAAIVAEIIRSGRTREPEERAFGAAADEIAGLATLAEVQATIRHELRMWEQDACGSRFETELRPEMREALAYIQSHLREDLKMNEVADYVHLSRSHFSALFKQSFGKTYLEYVMEQRMQRAGKLLKETRRKIYEIALDVGFSDYKYFNRCFREYFGLSPREWREAQ